MKDLSINEMITIEGGSFWNDVAYGAGYIAGKLNAAFVSISNRPHGDIRSWIHK